MMPIHENDTGWGLSAEAQAGHDPDPTAHETPPYLHPHHPLFEIQPYFVSHLNFIMNFTTLWYWEAK
jgi:hypothetical protein